MHSDRFQFAAIAAAIVVPAFADSSSLVPQPFVGVQRTAPLAVSLAFNTPNGPRPGGAIVPYFGGPAVRTNVVAAYDLFEGYLDTNGDGILDTLGPNGAPWDNLPGCTALIAPGFRWFGGPAYINAFASNDVHVAASRVGCCADIIDYSWFWNGDGLGGAANCAVIVFTSENWADCNAVVPDNGLGSLYPGVAYQFGMLPVGGWFANNNLAGTGLCHQMPTLDQDGGVQIFIVTYVDLNGDGLADDIDGDGIPDFLIPLPPGGGQPFLWGAGVDEVPPDGRCGDQADFQFNDDVLVDGIHTLPGECVSLAGGTCPNPLGAAIGFWCKVQCPCPGDINGDGIISLVDLTIFLGSFGGPPLSPCADINGDGIVDLLDLTLFLAVFGSPCTC